MLCAHEVLPSFFLLLASSLLEILMLRLISRVVSSIPYVTGSAEAESVRIGLFVGLGLHHYPCTPTVLTDTKFKHQGMLLQILVFALKLKSVAVRWAARLRAHG
jgi:hypothetical protein